MSRIIEPVGELDYLRLLFPDIGGTARSKILTPLIIPEFRLHGLTVFQGMLGIACEGTPCTRLLTESGWGNCIVKGDWSTLHASKTASDSGARYKDVICNMFQTGTGLPYPTDTRYICQRAVEQLTELGLQSSATYEVEFRLFKLSDGKPAWEPKEFGNAFVFSAIEPYLTELERSCRAAGLQVEVMHSEYGSGQVEVNLLPQPGVKAADHGFLFKLIAKEVARRHGFEASFMTKRLPGQTGNGWHLNLSLWSQDGHNAFYSDGVRPGLVGEQFVAGLLLHARALTAVSSPTVNCYRRLHTPWAPMKCNYGVDNRLTTFRLQTSAKETSRVESRIVSSACNPYLALAATLFAGMDGIRQGLSLEEADTGAELPHSFMEALEALKSDKLLSDSLGSEFMRWFETIKRDTEISALADVDTKQQKPEDFEREVKIYGRI